jgi:electron transfer flavoprotein alpha subunit
VLAEHKSGQLQPNTLHTLTAAKQLGGRVTVLVAGDSPAEAAASASQAEGVSSVLTAEDPCLANGLAEPNAALLAAVQNK